MEQFVSYEIAKGLKELGFNEDCFMKYRPSILSETIFEIYMGDRAYLFNEDSIVSAPTYQQAFEFFRTKQLYHEILIDRTTEPKFTFHIYEFVGNPKDLTEKEWGWEEPIFVEFLYRTYEKAEIACLEKLIEITNV